MLRQALQTQPPKALRRARPSAPTCAPSCSICGTFLAYVLRDLQDRKITNGFRSEWGADVYADIRCVVETGRRRAARASTLSA
jgi:hypothetical protein